MSEFWGRSPEPQRVTYHEAAAVIQRAKRLADLTQKLRNKIVAKLGEPTDAAEMGPNIAWAVFDVSSDQLDRENGEEDRQILVAQMSPFDPDPDASPSWRISSASTISTPAQDSLLLQDVLIDPRRESSHRIDMVELNEDEDEDNASAYEPFMFWLVDGELQTTEALRDPSLPDWFSRVTLLRGRPIMPIVNFYESGVQQDFEGALVAGTSMLDEIEDNFPFASGYLQD